MMMTLMPTLEIRSSAANKSVDEWKRKFINMQKEKKYEIIMKCTHKDHKVFASNITTTIPCYCGKCNNFFIHKKIGRVNKKTNNVHRSWKLLFWWVHFVSLRFRCLYLFLLLFGVAAAAATAVTAHFFEKHYEILCVTWVYYHLPNTNTKKQFFFVVHKKE